MDALERWNDAVALWRVARGHLRNIPKSEADSRWTWEQRIIEAIAAGMAARLPEGWATPARVACGE